MKVLFFLLLFVWNSCTSEEQIPENEVIETDAIWSNQLPADGCSWHFSVLLKDSSTVNLASDDASVAKIEKAIRPLDGAYFSTKVHLKYSLTGRKKEIECGWGKKSSLDEIKVLEIYKSPL